MISLYARRHRHVDQAICQIRALFLATAVLLPIADFPRAMAQDSAQSAPLSPGASSDAGKKRLPGSMREYTQTEIDDFFKAPDWYPDDHSPMPLVVSQGNRSKRVWACASCHLASGMGHPESANLAGLPAAYMVRHLMEYKMRSHFEPSPMHEIATGLSESEMNEASAWFAALKPQKSTHVEETDVVPRTAIQPRLVMRQVIPNGGTEPIDGRLIEVPADPQRVAMRDPYAGFVAYVPRGSIALGKSLATGGSGKTADCATCHGRQLKGTSEVPRLAGLSPDYVLRQMKAYKYGFRHGVQANLMKPAVSQLTTQEMIAIAAYVGSLDP